jgi:mono/diheme cytochrome c family protein
MEYEIRPTMRKSSHCMAILWISVCAVVLVLAGAARAQGMMGSGRSGQGHMMMGPGQSGQGHMMGSGQYGPGSMMGTQQNPEDLKTSWPKNKEMFDALSLGGQAYDDWAKLQGRELPKMTHPAYPAAGKRKGATTWRCKECHGWDYQGAKGAYAKGSHFTGIAGISAARNKSLQEIVKLLRGGVRGYTAAMIPDDLMQNIAQFVRAGPVDATKYIDYATVRARGDPTQGHHTYQHRCSACHGFGGNAINFKTKENPEYVGTVARQAPWEALHKIRVGQPGAVMPSSRDLSERQLADLLAYIQTLPAK